VQICYKVNAFYDCFEFDYNNSKAQRSLFVKNRGITGGIYIFHHTKHITGHSTVQSSTSKSSSLAQYKTVFLVQFEIYATLSSSCIDGRSCYLILKKQKFSKFCVICYRNVQKHFISNFHEKMQLYSFLVTFWPNNY
jgi:hypothetical protein